MSNEKTLSRVDLMKRWAVSLGRYYQLSNMPDFPAPIRANTRPKLYKLADVRRFEKEQGITKGTG